MASSHPASPRKLRIGVLLEAVQFSDIIGIDILGNLSKSYMSLVESIGEEWAAFAPHAIDMEYFFVATTLDPTEITPGLRIVPTVTYDECPRDLDMVLVGGPVPTHRPESADRFIKEAWAQTRVWFTTCTGSMWLASSGVVDGLRCTTNRGMLEIARGMHPTVEWVDQRWVVEEKPFEGEGKGELWTAGGAGAGRFPSMPFSSFPFFLLLFLWVHKGDS